MGNDDCVNCAYLPSARGVPKEESGFQTALEMIQGMTQGMELGRGSDSRPPPMVPSLLGRGKKQKGGGKKKKKGLRPVVTAAPLMAQRPVQYRPTKASYVPQQSTL